MTIEAGQRFPEGALWESTVFGEHCPVSPAAVNVADALRGKRVVIFGLPGAFTPTCSSKHVPSYLARYDELKAKGVDEIWCIAVNDGYVMAAWGREQQALEKIRFLGDGSGELCKRLGLERDQSASGMGLRMKRCSLFVDDGVVRLVNVDQPGQFSVSDADTMLRQLEENS